MTSRKRNWAGIAASAAFGMTAALATSAVLGAPQAVEGTNRPIISSAAPMARFYPTPLLSTPIGVVEDQDVWLAKVQGLMTGAPALLQQSLLSSQSAAEFSGNVALLQQMQEGVLKQHGAKLQSDAKGGLLPKIGVNGSSDLVYTTLPPCRIMDSRNASLASGVQGPLTGNTVYSIPGFITNGTNWGTYGGNGGSDCGLDSTVGADIWAVALVITVLNPNFDAFLGVSDSSVLATVLSNVALNYTHGQGLSTLYIVRQGSNNIRFAMPAGLSANIVFDVVGYFATSQATALDCADSAATTLPIAAGGSAQPFVAACPTGYARVSVTCFTDSFLVAMVTTNGSCSYHNFDGVAAHNVTATAHCCRVPGR